MQGMIWNFLWFVIVFVIMFFIYFFLLRRKMKKKKLQRIGEFAYLVNRFKLDTKKIDYKSLSIGVSFINSFIMAFVSTFIMLLPINMAWRLIVAFVMLMGLIYALYEIYGRHLSKKYGK